MGRRSKIPPPTSAQMAEAIDAAATGDSDRVICMLLGVSQTTFYRWLQDGEGPKARSPYREFREQLERAKGMLLHKSAATVRACAQSARIVEVHPRTITHADGRVEVLVPGKRIVEPGNLQAALKLLQVKDKEHWGEKSTMVVANVEAPTSTATDEEREVWRVLMGRSGGAG